MIQLISLISMVLTVIATDQSDQELLIKRNIGVKTCHEYFSVSSSLEPDSASARQLSGYLYRSLVGTVACKQDSAELRRLFKRPSFEKAVFLFFLDSAYFKLNHYETTSRWVEGYSNLISNCFDRSVAYSISDSLLYYKMDNGLIGLWNDGHINRLKNLESYILWCIKSNRLSGVLESIVILHNAKEYKERDRLIQKIRNRKNFQSMKVKFENLLSNNPFVDYELYAEEIYGGI